MDPETRDRSIAAMTLHGALPPRPRLAVVGSRAAHKRFRDLVPLVAECLRAHAWSLVSGGAIGIDGDSHRAALAAGVAQLAVLPCGPDRPYPPAHRELFAAMLADARSGLLYTQPAGQLPSKGMFASRNRHVVALADAVLVVEAAQPSGTLHTGRQALRDGVRLAAVIGSRGAALLVGRGAVALPPEPVAFAAAFEAWLSDADATGPTWPAHLLALRDALRAAGAAGLRLDRCSDPIAIAAAIVEADLLGLAVERTPGVWIATG